MALEHSGIEILPLASRSITVLQKLAERLVEEKVTTAFQLQEEEPQPA